MRYHRAGWIREVYRLIRHSGGFRTVRLNVMGWSVLLAPGLAVGILAARCLGSHVVIGALIGVVVVWVSGLIVDSRRWRASSFTVMCPDVPVASIERLVEKLRAEGVEAALELDESSSINGEFVLKIRSRMRHRNLIDRQLAGL